MEDRARPPPGRPPAPGCPRGWRWRRRPRRPSGRFAASCPITGSMPGRAQPLGVRRLGLVGPGHGRAELLRDEREAAHAGAADAHEVERAARERLAWGVTRQAAAAPPPSAPPRPASPPRGPRSPSPPSAAARASRPPTSRARRGPSSSASGTTTAAPAALHEAGVRGLVVAGGVRIGHEDRGQARGGQLEHRAAGAGDGEVGGGQRVGERLDVRRAAGSAAASRARRGARAGRRSRAARRRGAPRTAPRRRTRRARRRSAAARPSEPPKTSRHGPSGGDAEAGAGGGLVAAPGARRHGPPGDEPLRAVAGPRSGTPGTRARANGASSRFDTPRWLSASVSTSGRPQRARRQPHRPGHVAAAAEHGVGADLRRSRRRARPVAPRRQQHRPRRPQRVAAVDAPGPAARGTGSRRPARARPRPARLR